MSEEGRIARAREVLAFDVVMDAFKDLANGYRNAALHCDPKDDLGRFRLAEAEKAVLRVKAHIEGVATRQLEPEDAAQDFYKKKRRTRLF